MRFQLLMKTYSEIDFFILGYSSRIYFVFRAQYISMLEGKIEALAISILGGSGRIDG